jgi:hypothetical protein
MVLVGKEQALEKKQHDATIDVSHKEYPESPTLDEAAYFFKVEIGGRERGVAVKSPPLLPHFFAFTAPEVER